MDAFTVIGQEENRFILQMGDTDAILTYHPESNTIDLTLESASTYDTPDIYGHESMITSYTGLPLTPRMQNGWSLALTARRLKATIPRPIPVPVKSPEASGCTCARLSSGSLYGTLCVWAQ